MTAGGFCAKLVWQMTYSGYVEKVGCGNYAGRFLPCNVGKEAKSPAEEMRAARDVEAPMLSTPVEHDEPCCIQA